MRIGRLLEFDLEDLKLKKFCRSRSQDSGARSQGQESGVRSQEAGARSQEAGARSNSVRNNTNTTKEEGEVRRNDPGTFIPDSPQRT